MKKKFFIILYFITFIIYCYCDNSDDNIVKFRGSILLPLAYYFPNDPLNSQNHTSLIDYNYFHDFTDSGDKDNKYHDKDDPGRIIKPVSYLIETQIGFSLSIIYPLLRTNHFLFKNNNLAQTFIFEISPVSILGGMSAIFTPLPFLVLETGTTFGTGWNITALKLYGLARDNGSGNDPDIPEEKMESDSFFSTVMENWLKCTLQFDFSPLTPEKFQRWTHIVSMASFEFNNTLLLNYAYTDRPYYWKTNLNLNGWKYKSSFIVGYKVPVIIDEKKDVAEKRQWMGPVKHNNFSITTIFMTDIKIDLTHYNYSKMKDKGWGSDFVSCKFGPAIIFDLPDNLNLLVGFQWRNNIKYSEESVGNEDFMKRKYEDWYLTFYRIFLSFKWNF